MCGGPSPRVHRIRTEPAFEAIRFDWNGRPKLRRDYGNILGYMALCRDCNVRLPRYFKDHPSQRATRQACIEAWNRREIYSIVQNDSGLLPCPLCGDKDPKESLEPFTCLLYQHHDFELAERVTCPGCGFLLIGLVPDHEAYHFRYKRQSATVAWNKRVLPADWVDPKARKEKQLQESFENSNNMLMIREAMRAERKASLRVIDGGKIDSDEIQNRVT